MGFGRVITVIGSANIDLVIHVDRLPERGETVVGGRFQQTFGGKGANQAVAAARAGAQVSFVGAIGDDPLGLRYRELLEDDGIDTSSTAVYTGRSTGTALVVSEQAGDNYIAIDSGTNLDVGVAQIEDAREQIAASQFVLLQQEIHPSANERSLEVAREVGCPVILNSAPMADGFARPDDRVAGLVANEVEAGALLGMRTDPSDTDACVGLAGQLFERGGHRFVVVTLGAFGAVFVGDGTSGSVPARDVEVVDTTAAGDTFCGALAVALGERSSMGQAVSFATAASSLTVATAGALPSIPTRAQIDDVVGCRPA